MDVRRGRPELEEPGIAEAEKLAGASKSLAARGGLTDVPVVDYQAGQQAKKQTVGLIDEHKEHLTEAATRYAQGSLTAEQLKKMFAGFGWKPDISGMSVVAKDPNGDTHDFTQEAQAR